MVVLHPAEMQKACKILWRKQIYSTNNAFFCQHAETWLNQCYDYGPNRLPSAQKHDQFSVVMTF